MHNQKAIYNLKRKSLLSLAFGRSCFIFEDESQYSVTVRNNETQLF